MSQTGHPGADVCWLSIDQLTAGYRTGALSPIEVARALIARIRMLDPVVNAIVHLDEAYTLAMAEASLARWREGRPLSAMDGVPVTIKDLSAVAGMPKRRGSLAFGSEPVGEDTPCVARMREAGAVFLAKTATPEAGCKVVTRSPVHGVTANPYDLTRTPGGSSGGAAAALALGFGPVALGSDGAGSIRIPAAYTNLFGLKPGFGRVPAFPPDIDMPHSVVGPMARTVRDAAIMLAVISQPEPRDPYMWPVPFTPPADLAMPDLSDLRIAFSARLGCTAPLVDAESDALVAQATPLLADAGAVVEEAAPAWPVDPFLPFRVFWETACLACVEGTPAEKRRLLDPLILQVGATGARVSLTAYMRAMEQRMAIAAASKAFFTRYDLLVGPVMPVPPYSVLRDVPEGYANEDWSWCPYTYPWNMTGQPAASVPIGFTEAGLPVGVQIIGPMGGEADVLRAARAIELRRPLHLRRPPLLG
ncbi:amidase family protein [Bosea sp. 117]|uniref:amidase family protein n=1 Tax=Bosea sp. 117 TaxID=1125973 RepID=UPI000AE1C3E8|nr:amidase family protein [Bosea sp. 117]